MQSNQILYLYFQKAYILICCLEYCFERLQDQKLGKKHNFYRNQKLYHGENNPSFFPLARECEKPCQIRPSRAAVTRSDTEKCISGPFFMVVQTSHHIIFPILESSLQHTYVQSPTSQTTITHVLLRDKAQHDLLWKRDT